MVFERNTIRFSCCVFPQQGILKAFRKNSVDPNAFSSADKPDFWQLRTFAAAERISVCLLSKFSVYWDSIFHSRPFPVKT